jgi:hypothetical protein
MERVFLCLVVQLNMPQLPPFVSLRSAPLKYFDAQKHLFTAKHAQVTHMLHSPQLPAHFLTKRFTSARVYWRLPGAS